MATLVEAAPEVIGALEAKLTDPTSTLAQKYRVLFSLRNLAGEQAHRALEAGAVTFWRLNHASCSHLAATHDNPHVLLHACRVA